MDEVPEKMAATERNEKFSDDCSLSVLLQPFHMTPKQLQLLEAARKNDVTELEKLLTNHVNVNARNNLDRTALHWAAANGHGDAIDVLFRAAANVNATDKYGMTPLLLASWFGHVVALEKLVKNKSIVINCFNKQGMNAIHCAAMNDHINVLEFFHVNQFVDKIDINKKELRGKTSLHLGAERGFEEMVDYLLAIGSNPLLTDLTGRTALHLAAAGGHSDVTRILLRIPGLDINLPDNEGLAALHLASAAGHTSVVHRLMSVNADINAHTQKGMSALTLASAGGHLETASQLLMDPLCNRNHTNEDGNTALHLASSNNSVNMVRLLVANGCDVNLANKLGQTSLHIAAEMGHAPVVKLLLAARSDLARRDDSGKTPLTLAARANHVSIADMIIRQERLQKILNITLTPSENQSNTVTGSKMPSVLRPAAVEGDVVGCQTMPYGATRYQEAAAETQNGDQEQDEDEDENLSDLRPGSAARTRNKQWNDQETQEQESRTGDQEQEIGSTAQEHGTSVHNNDEIDEGSGYPAGYHNNLDDDGDSENVLIDGMSENRADVNRTGTLEVIPNSADDVGNLGRNIQTYCPTPNPNSERRYLETPGECYMNTVFSLDESLDLRAGPRHGLVEAGFPVPLEEPGSRDDEISVPDSDCFLATSSTVDDADWMAPVVGETDLAISSAVGGRDAGMSADLASDLPVRETGSIHSASQPKEPQSRNLIRSISAQSHASAISLRTSEHMAKEISVFEDGHTSAQQQQKASETLLQNLSDQSALNEATAVRGQQPVGCMFAMKEVLWKLATRQLKQGDWKSIARHLQFNDDQIRAIEHQYTGSKSYRDHGYRMLVIWLECYLEVNPPPNGNPVRDLFDALVAIDRRKLAEQFRNKFNRANETRKSCTIS